MHSLDYFIYFTFGIKVIFFVLTILNIILETINRSPEWVEYINKARHRLEFLFIACMSVLLIIYFNPRAKSPPEINSESRLLLFAYGIIVLLSADWSLFFKESPVLKKFQGKE
jgi:multisubunit Na+/H+ antiporter MnhB subunit